MTTLAADKPRTYEERGKIETYPVVASDIIYEGAAVGEDDSGYAQPLVAGQAFLGFAQRTVDNSAGLAGAKNVQVYRSGDVLLPITDLAITANDRPAVYAADDDDFTLTSTSNSKIGWVSRWTATGFGVIQFRATEV